MELKSLTTGPLQQICYLLWNDPQRTLVIDPGAEAERIARFIKDRDLTIAAFICTHGHTDHIGALADLHGFFPAPILIHSLDLSWAFEPVNHLSPIHGVPERPINADYVPLEDAEKWPCDLPAFQCIETPGHTPGSCCLFFSEEQLLISGDTLFRGTYGRTDLPGGNPHEMKNSLQKLKQLPDTTRVYPGHGPDTTIGIEKATNPFFGVYW